MRDVSDNCGVRSLPAVTGGNYEIELSINDEPFWEPASVEGELRNQLKNIALVLDDLT